MHAGLDIGNYVCGEQAEEPTIITINEQVESVASAIAEAFAEVSADCHASGNAEVRAQGYSFAQDRAEALGSAVSEIFASAEVCGQCSAVVSALSETTQLLVAEAVAEAWTQVRLQELPYACCRCWYVSVHRGPRGTGAVAQLIICRRAVLHLVVDT